MEDIISKAYVRTLFALIGAELGIPANLLIDCKEYQNQPESGWATSLKGVNWIYINLRDLVEALNKAIAVNGFLKFDGLSWLQVRNIKIALFCVLIHEYSHIYLTGSSRSLIGLTETDYFNMLKPLGDRVKIGEIINRERTPEEITKENIWQDKQHDENFYTHLRINAHRCGRILEELKEEGR
ncbi:MAG TPA: hypothetical protein DCK76_11940 [Desulfotomaculum sp.]|nr:hypothetical protein [Desulfotomaculum sp.]HBY04191.1 hypothetical protein [Desulfotomaculum sp.]